MSGDDRAGGGGYRIAIDTGGTFTDVAVSRSDGSVFVWKVSSTPDAPDNAVMAGLREALDQIGADFTLVSRFVHGTTVATNALITRTGARVALMTTQGFEDLLAIGHQARPSLYDQHMRRPSPLVPSELTWAVRERTAGDGSEVLPVDPDSLAKVAEEIRDAAPEVVVVSLLNAYADPRHEQEVAERFQAAGVAGSVFAATSVTSEIREYERTSTAVINGYVQPKIADYLDRLAKRLAEHDVSAPLWVMQSNGGLVGARTAQHQSVRTVLSGLAGGVVGAARWSKELELPLAVSFDIGGTSTDIALIRNGVPDEMISGEIEGHPLRIPAVDVHTIGAGGGSIAWRDSGGGLRVGPHSAGARPGPVCYGRGGTEVTVTDAHAVLGRLGEKLLDGRLELDVDSVRSHIARFAADLGLDCDATAAGVLRVINTTMARGIRKVSIERGIDLRKCTLIAFGGAGPLHAADLIRDLGMRAAVIPPHPGIASAIGMLDAPVRQDFAMSVSATNPADMPSVARVLDELAGRAQEFIAQEAVGSRDTEIVRLVDVRYLGQSHELTVPWNGSITGLRASFDAVHAERYGFDDPDADLEIVTARVTAVADQARESRSPALDAGEPPAPVAHREVFFDGKWLPTPVYRRAQLSAEIRLAGPLIVEQLDSTVVVGPGQLCRNDERGFLHINTEEDQ